MEGPLSPISTQRSASLSIIHELDTAVRFRGEGGSGTPGPDLLRYVYRPAEAQFESPRPYVHPVRTLSGRLVTVFRPWDHVWHKGITMALPNVGRDNFWGGATYTRQTGGYADLKNNGSQDHERMVALAGDSDLAAFTHVLRWHRQHEPGAAGTRGDAVFTEVRTLSATLLPAHDAWALGWRSTLTNVSGAPIEMGSPTTEGRENAGYGGLFWRGPRSFTGGRLIASNGALGEDVRGTRGQWAGFCGRHDGIDGASSVVFVDQTPAQDLDTKWFVRAEPFACINPAPFFDRVRVIDAEETIDLRYTVVIADGSADGDRMADLAAAAVAASERASIFVEANAAIENATGLELAEAR